MLLNQKAIMSLIQALLLTNETELDCDGCLELLAEFAEQTLLGQTLPSALTLVEKHLELCVDCREEFLLLRDILQELDPALKKIA